MKRTLKTLKLKEPNGETVADVLISHINESSSLPLSKEHAKLLERISYADNLINNNYQDRIVVKKLREKFHPLGQTRAYHDIILARHVFNSTRVIDKNYEIYLLLEANKKAMRIALETTSRWQVHMINDCIKSRIEILKLVPGGIESAQLTQNNFYMIIKSDKRKSPVKIDLDRVHEISPEELDRLEENISDALLDKTTEIALQG